MIRITLANEYINNFPTLKAVAYFCENEPNLWRYSFLDEERLKWISWLTVQNEVAKLQQEKGK